MIYFYYPNPRYKTVVIGGETGADVFYENAVEETQRLSGYPKSKRSAELSQPHYKSLFYVYGRDVLPSLCLF